MSVLVSAVMEVEARVAGRAGNGESAGIALGWLEGCPLTAPPHKDKSRVTKDSALFRIQPHPNRGKTPQEYDHCPATYKVNRAG